MGTVKHPRRLVVTLRLLAVLAAIGSAAGCAPPYFMELDAAASLIRQMSPVGVVGPASIPLGQAGSTVRFLPSRPTATSFNGLSITSGFAVASSSTQDDLSFVYLDASGKAWTGSPDYQVPMSGADPNYPLYEYDVLPTPTTQPSIMVFRYDPSTLAASTYQQILATPSTGPVTTLFAPAAFLTNNIFLAYTPIGGSIDPAPPGNSFTFLNSSGGTSTSVFSVTVNATGSFPPASPQTPVPNQLPPNLLRALLFNNVKLGTTVAQYRSGSAWVCVQWAGAATPTAMTGVTKRLDAVLSDGDLLSTEGDTLTLYDSSTTGTEVLSTPLHGLQFCYEGWIGTTPYVFFSLSIEDRHGKWIFSVYAIPTSGLRSLK